MLEVSRGDVVQAPFPHVVKQGILPAEFFTRLKTDFPTEETFLDQFAQTGAAGSRVGKGTGFDIYRGDASFDQLVAQSSAWTEFDAYINSPSFVKTFLEVFGPDLDALGCSVKVDPAAYDRGNVEGREVLTEHKGLGTRVREMSHKLLGGKDKTAPLFTRLDVEKSVGGYAKPPHCDRGNRLCSLIVYFTDMEKEGIEGGELKIFAHKQAKAPSAHERHPKEADVNVVATLSPKENLGVFFPCSSNSYHGVNAVRTQGKARDFLYINISADVPTCW
jgi:hypothetical protein